MTRYLTRVHTFWCDAPGCNWSLEENGTAAEAWRYAREQGWRSRNGQHYCPTHSSTDSEGDRG